MPVYFYPEDGLDLWFPAEGPAEADASGILPNPRGRLREPKRPPERDMFNSLFVSVNTKTLFSINLRIANTNAARAAFPNVGIPKIPGSCRPTLWCVRHCYAKAGMMAQSFQQRRYLANLVFFHKMKTASEDVLRKESDALAKKVRTWGLDNIRLSGGGDLTPGYVRFVNFAAKRHPKIIFWGMTKRADMLKKMANLKNIVIQPSLDYTSPGLMGGRLVNPSKIKEFVDIVKRRGWSFCYSTEHNIQSDPQLQPLRSMGLPVMTSFGDHVGDFHTDIGDQFQCPCTHPAVIPFYWSVRPEEFPGPSGPKGPSICQACRWCITPASLRKEVLPWKTPMESLSAFRDVAGGRLWVWGPEGGSYVINPASNIAFWKSVQSDMGRAHPWFTGLA